MTFLRLIVFAIFVSAVFSGCSSLPSDPGSSSSDFTRAKYLTELVYLTDDKELVDDYRDAYNSGQTNKQVFRELNEWSKGRDRETILETIELFLDLKFEGQ